MVVTRIFVLYPVGLGHNGGRVKYELRHFLSSNYLVNYG